MRAENNAFPRVSIAVPSSGMVHAGFAMALANLCTMSRDLPIQLSNVRSSIIAIARNNAVEEAQKFRADYILFLDSDMEFPPNTLLRLLLHKQAIVGATYVKRVSPFKVIGRALTPQPDPVPKGLIEMERIPTGCLLIRLDVFERLVRPYFYFGINESREIVGEDFQFCDDVRRAGLRVWCDASLTQEITHLGERACRLTDSMPELAITVPVPPSDIVESGDQSLAAA